VGLSFFVQPLIGIIPKYAKWEPAILAFYLLTISSLFAGLTTPLTNALNAIGKIKVTLGLMVMWTGLTWVLTLILIRLYGFNGVPMAFLAVSTTIVVVVKLVKQYVEFSFWKNIVWALVASTIQGVWYFTILRFVPHTLMWLILAGSSGVILYAGIVWTFEKRRIMETIASFKTAV